MIFTPTPQQTAFYTTAPTKQSVALKARAGTGKTHSEQQWAIKARGTGRSTSFSKGTVDELGRKMPSGFPAATIHSDCLRAIRTSGKYTRTQNNHPFSPASKMFNLTKALFKEREADRELFTSVLHLVGLAKTFGIIPAVNNREGLRPDTPEVWEDLADQYDINYNTEVLALSRELLIESNRLALKEGYLDFDDMLYIAVLWPHRFVRYPTIIVDEAQDLSAIQVEAIAKMLMPGGRVIAAGDDRQAIYAFRGALADSYSALSRKFNMIELPLTWSFRCPRAVILEAQQWVPDIEAHPSAVQGDVITHADISLYDLPRTIVCRNNAPLIRLALRLLVAGRTAEVAGKDIGAGLISLTKRITKRNLKTDEFLVRLDKWAEREISRKPSNKPNVRDKQAALEALAAHHPDLKSIQAHLTKLYPDPRSRTYRPAEVHLTTIHKAKGKEWDEVLILDPYLMPSKYAEQPWELLQEDNMAYVAVTRAKQILHYADSNNIHE